MANYKEILRLHNLGINNTRIADVQGVQSLLRFIEQSPLG